MFTRVDGRSSFWVAHIDPTVVFVALLFLVFKYNICAHDTSNNTRRPVWHMVYTTLDMKFMEDYKIFRDIHKTPNIPPHGT